MMGGSLKELDETAYWLELLVEGEIVPAIKLTDLQKETDELIAIFLSPLSICPKGIIPNKFLHSSF
jgi:hypothetical protein